MMFTGYDKTVNVLALTDEEVATDWRNGMLRSIAHTITKFGIAEGIQSGTWGTVLGFTEGSLAEHIYTIPGAMSYLYGMGSCEAISVTDLYEDTFERYEHDTFGPGTTRNEALLGATVTCKHQITGKMTFASSMGEMIYTIARDNDM
jgi:hypothetical protein